MVLLKKEMLTEQKITLKSCLLHKNGRFITLNSIRIKYY